MFKLLETGVLTHDIADVGLTEGDMGTTVEVYSDDAFEIEFVAASGKTQALFTLYGKDIRLLTDQDTNKLIDRRLAEYLANPADVIPWAQVRKKLDLWWC
jgi:Domain of unknown function (DUF4926)